MHVLEAVIVATIMIGAVAYVATFDVPPSPTGGSRDILEKKATDALRVLYDTPASSPLGDNELSVLILECMQGNCTDLSTRLKNLLPPGASFALYVSNGYKTYPVLVTREPTGETVTATQLLEPSWSSSFLASARNRVNASRDPLLVYSLPIFNSNAISQGGSPLRVMVHGVRASDGSNFTLTGYYSTLAAKTSEAGNVPAVSLNWLVPQRDAGDYIKAWVEGSVGNWSSQTVEEVSIDGGASFWRATGTPVNMYLVLNETGNVAVPAGTTLNVAVPRGWVASANETYNPGWRVLENATDANGTYGYSNIRAELKSDLKNSTIQFGFNATYRGDLPAAYHFQASLSSGALAEANMLAIANRSNKDGHRAPAVHMSLPRPMGAGNMTTWSLAIDIPEVDRTVSASDPFSVTRSPLSALDRRVFINKIEIIELNGAKIFGSEIQGTGYANHTFHATSTYTNPVTQEQVTVTNRESFDIVNESVGTWTSLGERLVWTGELDSSTGPLGLRFNVNASGVAGSQLSKNPFVPPVTFDNHKGRLLTQSNAGMYRYVVLPERLPNYEGYQAFDADGLPVTTATQYSMTTDAVFKSTRLPGSTTYVVDTGAAVADSLYGSYVAVEKPSVPIGGQVVLTADVQSMLFALADAGQQAGVTLNFYPPWSGDNRTPILTRPNLDTGFLESTVEVLTLLDVNNDGYADPILGTNNGRVLAFDAVTGLRVTGRLFTVAVNQDLNSNTTAAAVTHLEVIHLDGEPYIVVGTDGNSGVYVIDRNFNRVWSYAKRSGFETVAVHTQTDLAQGDGGRPEIILTLRDPNAATSTFQVMVLKAVDGQSTLTPVPPANGADTSRLDDPTHALADVFYIGTGVPSALTGLDLIGPDNEKPGIVVSVRTLPGGSTYTQLTHTELTVSGIEQSLAETKILIESPRHGMVGLDSDGNETYLFFGSPVTSAARWNHDNRDGQDILAGSPSGYVFALNGSLAAQPAYPLIFVGAPRIVDGECHDWVHCVLLFSSGDAIYTRGGWGTSDCFCDPKTGWQPSYPDATSVALNTTASFWMAGLNSQLWYAEPNPLNESRPFFSPHVAVVQKLDENGVAGVMDFASNPYHFFDITFGWGETRDIGHVVGGSALYVDFEECVNETVALEDLHAALGNVSAQACAQVNSCDATSNTACPESLVMRTLDGGQTWWALTSQNNSLLSHHNTTLNEVLTRVNFTTPQVGWITGTNGTLLRTLDGGATWRGLNLSTNQKLTDVSCDVRDPNFCVVVGNSGFAKRSYNALEPYPRWDNLTESLGSEAGTRDLLSVGVANKSNLYIGTRNMLLQSLDEGSHWSVLPMNYLTSDVNRFTVFPGGTGFAYGGNETVSRLWFLPDFVTHGNLQTVSLTPHLDPDDRIINVNVSIERHVPSGGAADIWASSDGGDEWFRPVFLNDTISRYVQRHDYIYPVPSSETAYNVSIPSSAQGSDLRVRLNLSVGQTHTLWTPHVKAFFANYTYIDGATGTTQYGYAEFLPSRAADASYVDVGKSTAHWDASVGTVHLNRSHEFWTQNVSGQVYDVKTGMSVTGDARHDAWVSTGAVLASNSPDYALYAGSSDDRIGSDNRVYLLDGQAGHVVAATPQLAGEVLKLALSDTDGNLQPERLFAVAYAEGNHATTLYALDPTTLQQLWNTSLMAQPTDLETGLTEKGEVGAFLATAKPPDVTEALQSRVSSYVAPGRPVWSMLPDERGQIQVSETIPDHWFFGPYVVEIVVDWKADVHQSVDGQLVTREVAEAARFYDYFVVTPPDSLSPPSPVYDVRLVTWFPDWG